MYAVNSSWTCQRKFHIFFFFSAVFYILIVALALIVLVWNMWTVRCYMIALESMMSVVLSSLVGVGVARQSNPEHTHSGIVRALEGGWWRCRCRGHPAVSGGWRLFLSALFKLPEGPVGCQLCPGRYVPALPQQRPHTSGFPWHRLSSASLAARGFCVPAQVPRRGAVVEWELSG